MCNAFRLPLFISLETDADIAAFRQPLVTSLETDTVIAKRMIALSNEPNKLQ